MLAVSFLNDIIVQKNNYSSADILNELRGHIKEALHQTGEFGEAHGGMDIVLCIIDPQLSKMQFAGAFNSLYFVSSNTSTGNPELTEYKGDSMPVGIYLKNEPFTNHLIDLHDGDQFYIFSDGFIDQFGGPKNKKLLSKNFKNIILVASQMPICDQRNFLKNAFTEWQGDNPQTDDVLLMGIRYSNKPLIN
jgi:serine phosphatase RsbU (regulator of sigma subunit)